MQQQQQTPVLQFQLQQQQQRQQPRPSYPLKALMMASTNIQSSMNVDVFFVCFHKTRQRQDMLN
jgi:hypothetical protein